jgi:hypothetical protein
MKNTSILRAIVSCGLVIPCALVAQPWDGAPTAAGDPAGTPITWIGCLQRCANFDSVR